jgi:hypothetical protein
MKLVSHFCFSSSSAPTQCTTGKPQFLCLRSRAGISFLVIGEGAGSHPSQLSGTWRFQRGENHWVNFTGFSVHPDPAPGEDERELIKVQRRRQEPTPALYLDFCVRRLFYGFRLRQEVFHHPNLQVHLEVGCRQPAAVRMRAQSPHLPADSQPEPLWFTAIGGDAPELPS